MKNQLFLVLISSFIIVAPSCLSPKKMSLLKNLSSENKLLKGKLDSEIKKNNELANEKEKAKEIDSTSNSEIKHFLDSSANQANKDFQEDPNFSNAEKLKFSEELNRKLNQNLTNVKIITDLLNQKTFIRFSTGALFKPGGYIIEDDLYKPALKAFTPVIDTINNFVKKYPSTRFKATIAILGYSDATPIGKGGTLYNFLSEKLNNPNADKSTMNLKLSELRAESVTTIFNDLTSLKICKEKLLQNVDLTIVPFGRGEELPDPKMSNVTEDDERRRAVIAYWTILPQ